MRPAYFPENPDQFRYPPAREFSEADLLASNEPPRRNPLRPRTRGVMALTGASACWGFATVMSKGALEYIPPFTLLAAQLTSSVLFLWIVVALRRIPVTIDSGARRAALSGILEPGLAYAAGISGLALTGAAHSSLISALEPLFIVLLAWIAIRIRPAALTQSAIAFAVVGVALVSFNPGAAAGVSSLVGDTLVLVGTLIAALYVVISSRLATRIEPLPLATLQQSVGLFFAILLLGFAIGTGIESVSWAEISTTTWLLAIVAGIVQFALAFWLYLIGLRTMPLATAALFLALIPVFGVGGAMVFLGERLTLIQGIGCASVICAILVSSRDLACFSDSTESQNADQCSENSARTSASTCTPRVIATGDANSSGR